MNDYIKLMIIIEMFRVRMSAEWEKRVVDP